MVSGILAHVPSFSKLRSGRNDDAIDRLNHVYTVIILVVFAVIVSTSQFVGDPIHCWCPAEFNDKRVDYTKSYCWIGNTYHIPFDAVLPVEDQPKRDAEVTYYQWVPLILLFQAFLFKFPNMVWKILNTGSGLNITRIARLAEDTQLVSPEDRTKTINDLAHFLDCWLQNHQPVYHNYKSSISRFGSNLKSAMCFTCNKRRGRYLTSVFLFVKLLFLTNVVGQFYLLDSFMSMDYSNLGAEYVRMLRTGQEMRESRRFPRVTMCDFQIRLLQNIQDYTVQCVLPINLYNEKIFVFLWFWFVLVATLCALNFLKWLYLVLLKKNNYKFVRKYLILADSGSEPNKKLCKEFADKYLRDDGCFVIRVVGMNSSDLVVTDMLKYMFDQYNKSKEKEAYIKNN